MARFYSNENVPIQAVRELRRLGHDVLTSIEAQNANRSGIIVCTYDPEFSRLAARIGGGSG